MSDMVTEDFRTTDDNLGRGGVGGGDTIVDILRKRMRKKSVDLERVMKTFTASGKSADAQC